VIVFQRRSEHPPPEDQELSAPAVLHIPHSSDQIPADCRGTFLVSDERLGHELLAMTDRYTDELFALPPVEALTLRFPVSRLVVDPERYGEDAREPMAARGMGVVYTRTSDGSVLRTQPSSSERAALLERFYTPHHEALSAAVKSMLSQHGACLLVDCHSFPSEPLPCDLDQTPGRPAICLGTDRFHTPDWLRDSARSQFEAAGFDVTIDRPYAGVLVPAEHAGRVPSLYALMIEINRRLYMDEETGEKLDAFPRVADTIRGVLRTLINETRSRMAARSRPATGDGR
jgi:N-formylglutamate amidohydrolase